jgi:hypothetical protein
LAGFNRLLQFSGEEIIMKRHQPIFLLFTGIACIFVWSCTMVDSVTKKPGLAETEGKMETFYVGLDGLKLFPEPRFSKTCIASLPLNEAVVRDKLEKGFAHVRVVSTGQTGWVNNAHLIWRASPPPKPVSIEPAPPPKPLPPKPASEKKSSEENMIQEPSHPNPDVEGRDANIFDRF